MIEATHLTKKYGSLVAVDDLSLSIQNELFVFLGPNGAGKTTTIKMMTGLLKPSNGTVLINGFNIETQAIEAKRQIDLVPEMPYLYPKLTGREFLSFMAKIHNMENNTTARRLDNLVDLFDMSERIDELIENYSHGMKQKIALSGALIHDPQVLFLDEPTVGLDPKSAKHLKTILKELVGRGVTIFMSTHILEIAEAMCDRVAIINYGKLIVDGSVDELRKTHEQMDKSLEDIFLELTGSSEEKEVLKYLE